MNIEQLREQEDDLEQKLAETKRAIRKLEGPKLGKLPNKRAGFYHIHSASYECGMAYREYEWGDESKWRWNKCSKLVNHEDGCGYEDNTAY
ncbi:hypothetical protein SEA_BIG4_162 [Microbacterium phage Big4]|nr:hypothetical protein SEA_BIG4_162 [Microbacterium phage Big4]